MLGVKHSPLQRACARRAQSSRAAAAVPAVTQCAQHELAAAVLRVYQQHQPQQQPVQEASSTGAQGVIQQLKQGCSAMAAVLPLASTSLSHTSTEAEIYFGLAKAVDIYLMILTVRVLLSWFRSIDWFKEPWNTLRQLTDPFLNVFRGIIPAIGGIDLSPMLGFFLLNFIRNLLMQYSHVM